MTEEHLTGFGPAFSRLHGDPADAPGIWAIVRTLRAGRRGGA